MTEFSDDNRLYLDDLQIGQRFSSGTHVVNEEQIKHLPDSSILSPSTLITRRPRTPFYRAWRQAVGTRLRSPRGFWSTAACRRRWYRRGWR
jgi:hypothetical protein